MTAWMEVVMGFDRDSSKWRLGLSLASVIAAVALSPWSPWSRWVALALAGFGLGIGIPLWLGRSWRNILESTGLVLRSLLRAPGHSLSMEKGQESDRLPALERVRHRMRIEDLPKSARGAPEEAAERLRRSFHTWPLQTREQDASAKNTLHPQNVLRLAAESVQANPGHEKPVPPAEPREVIDLPSILENLEKRYGGKEPAGQTPAPELQSAKAPQLTIDMEEIRRRLKATYGTRLSGGVRQSSSRAPEKTLRGAGSEPRAGGADAPASRGGMPAGSSSPAGRKAGDAFQGVRPVFKRGIGPDAAGDAPRFGPRESLPRQVMEGATPSVSDAVPVSTALSGQRDIGHAEDAFTATSPHETGGLLHPGGSSEGYAREFLTELPAFDSEAGDPGWPVPDDGSNPFSAQFQDDVHLPPLSLLAPADSAVAPMNQDDLIEGGILIEEKLAEFRVKVIVQDAYAGPVITRYEVQPAVGVRGGQVVSLMKDLARALGVAAIRVVETIPGKTCMGLELPNPHRQMIRLSEVLSSEAFQSHPSKLAMALGKDITGEPVVADLARAPHMLVAGTTGSGKSVGVNAMILSLLYRATPEEVRFVMIDPKMLELSIYDGIPHLLAPVVTDMKLAANALDWCVGEMERRYRLMSGFMVRNLAGYNQKVRDAVRAGEPLLDPFSPTQDDPEPLSPLPYVVVVVDELADLMMVTGKKIEELIARLAQKARAAGIHLIIATQRPSVDVITGLIKANIPTRIAFQVSSKIDSRTILDQMGAECLLGQGDMLYLPPGVGYPQRVHGAFVADEEVHAIAEHLRQFGEPHYVEGVLGGVADADDAEAERFGDEADPLYDQAVAFVVSSRRASISAVQRHLRIGYNRAARLVEQMEASGLVSPMESNGNRTVLVPARPE